MFGYVQNNPVNFIDPWGLYSLQQGLQDTSSYAWVAGAASAFIPGGQTASIVFAGIGTVATVAERVLYPKDSIDPTVDLLKASTPLPGGPFMNKFKDGMIDLTHEAIKRDAARAAERAKYDATNCQNK